MYYKIVLTLFCFLFMSIFSLSSTYASCITYDFVDVSQSGFQTSYSFSDYSLYTNGNTISNPVTLDFYFQSSTRCVQNYTLQTVITTLQDSISKEFVVVDTKNYTKVTFIVNNLNIESFDVAVLYDSQDTVIKQFELRKDEITPQLSVILRDENNIPIGNSISPGSNITLDINFNDVVNGYGSDIYLLDVGQIYYNGAEFNTSLEGSKKPGSYSLEQTIFVNQNFIIQVQDKLGNKNQTTFFLRVDGESPVLNGFSSGGVFFEEGSRLYSFSVEVSDSSFSEFIGPENVTVSFSPTSILQGSDVIADECRFIVGSKYVCLFSMIPIITSTTSDVVLTITAEDDLGNEGSYEITKEIFIDSSSPEIIDFYFENSFGGKNIVSPLAQGHVLVYLTYFDQTGLAQGNGITPFFDEIEFPSENGECSDGCYFWNLSTGNSSSNFGKYVDLDNEDAIFRVVLRDEYGYIAEINRTLLFDRYTPMIINSSFEEGDETCIGDTIVRDSIIQSCEEFDIKVTVHELEERFGEDLTILGNFTSISTKRDLIAPDCSISNLGEDLLEYNCVFENLEAAQGHLLTNYSIIVQDSAGNRVEEVFDFEILNASYDGVEPRFEIRGDNLIVLAPLSRVLLDENGGSGQVTAWFEGTIADTRDNSGFEIVNYQLLNCVDFSIEVTPTINDSLRVLNEQLYPNTIETVFTSDDGVDGVDREFVMNFIVDKYANPTLLNTLQTQCTMALLYRDETTLYEPPQLINFTVEVEFYDLPRGHLLKAFAEDLNNDLESIEKTEKWFRDIYDTYEDFHNICNTWTTISTGIETVGVVTRGVTTVLKEIPYTKAAGVAIDEFMTPTQGNVGEMSYADYMDEFCGYVTCQNLLLPGFKELMDEQYLNAAGFCGELASSFSLEVENE